MPSELNSYVTKNARTIKTPSVRKNRESGVVFCEVLDNTLVYKEKVFRFIRPFHCDSPRIFIAKLLKNLRPKHSVSNLFINFADAYRVAEADRGLCGGMQT